MFPTCHIFIVGVAEGELEKQLTLTDSLSPTLFYNQGNKLTQVILSYIIC